MEQNSLLVTVEATHQSLEQRLAEATRRGAERRPHDARARVNAFMAATSRHLAAVDEALLPEVARRLPDGHRRAAEYLHAARRLEQALVRLKARLYGELHVAHLPWPGVVDEVRRNLTEYDEVELALVRDLTAGLDRQEADALADRVYRAELRAPPGPTPTCRTPASSASPRAGSGRSGSVLGHHRGAGDPAAGPPEAAGPQPRQPALAVPGRRAAARLRGAGGHPTGRAAARRVDVLTTGPVPGRHFARESDFRLATWPAPLPWVVHGGTRGGPEHGRS